MASAQEIYEQLLEDPNLDVGPNQTREEAAKIEAEYRARQYMNNVRALALANEPLKADTPIKALLNHVQKEALQKLEINPFQTGGSANPEEQLPREGGVFNHDKTVFALHNETKDIWEKLPQDLKTFWTVIQSHVENTNPEYTLHNDLYGVNTATDMVPRGGATKRSVNVYTGGRGKEPPYTAGAIRHGLPPREDRRYLEEDLRAAIEHGRILQDKRDRLLTAFKNNIKDADFYNLTDNRTKPSPDAQPLLAEAVLGHGDWRFRRPEANILEGKYGVLDRTTVDYLQKLGIITDFDTSETTLAGANKHEIYNPSPHNLARIANKLHFLTDQMRHKAKQEDAWADVQNAIKTLNDNAENITSAQDRLNAHRSGRIYNAQVRGLQLDQVIHQFNEFMQLNPALLADEHNKWLTNEIKSGNRPLAVEGMEPEDFFVSVNSPLEDYHEDFFGHLQTQMNFEDLSLNIPESVLNFKEALEDLDARDRNTTVYGALFGQFAPSTLSFIQNREEGLKKYGIEPKNSYSYLNLSSGKINQLYLPGSVDDSAEDWFADNPDGDYEEGYLAQDTIGDLITSQFEKIHSRTYSGERDAYDAEKDSYSADYEDISVGPSGDLKILANRPSEFTSPSHGQNEYNMGNHDIMKLYVSGAPRDWDRFLGEHLHDYTEQLQQNRDPNSGDGLRELAQKAEQNHGFFSRNEKDNVNYIRSLQNKPSMPTEDMESYESAISPEPATRREIQPVDETDADDSLSEETSSENIPPRTGLERDEETQRWRRPTDDISSDAITPPKRTRDSDSTAGEELTDENVLNEPDTDTEAGTIFGPSSPDALYSFLTSTFGENWRNNPEARRYFRNIVNRNPELEEAIRAQASFDKPPTDESTTDMPSTDESTTDVTPTSAGGGEGEPPTEGPPTAEGADESDEDDDDPGTDITPVSRDIQQIDPDEETLDARALPEGEARPEGAIPLEGQVNITDKLNEALTAMFGENWQSDPDAQKVASHYQESPRKIDGLYEKHVIKPLEEKSAKQAKFKTDVEALGFDSNDERFQNIDVDQHARLINELKEEKKEQERQQKEQERQQKEQERQQEQQQKEQAKQQEEQQKRDPSSIPISDDAQRLPVNEGFIAAHEKRTGKKIHPDVATTYLRLLRAHGEIHKDPKTGQSYMTPETQEKFYNAIKEAIENGADTNIIDREYEEHGPKASSTEFISEKHSEHLQREKHRESLKGIISNPHHLKSAYYENMAAQGQTTDDIHLHGLSEPSELPHNSWHAWGTNQKSFAQQEALHNIQHGNAEQRKAGKDALAGIGIPPEKWLDNDESHVSNQPPDPEKARELMAQGYEWNPQTHHWHLREDVKKLHEDIAARARKNNNRARGAIIHGAKTNFNGKAFALHPDGSTSHEFFAAANGRLHRVGGVNFNKPVVNNHDVASHALGLRLNQAESQNPGKVLPKPGQIKHHANLYDKNGYAYGTGMEQYLPKGRKETLNVRQRIETAAPTRKKFDARALTRGLQESWRIFIGKGDFVSALELLHSQLELNQIALEKSKELSIIK
jgi:hypothetical protein